MKVNINSHQNIYRSLTVRWIKILSSFHERHLAANKLLVTGQLRLSSRKKSFLKLPIKRQYIWTVTSHYKCNYFIEWLCHSKKHHFSWKSCHFSWKSSWSDLWSRRYLVKSVEVLPGNLIAWNQSLTYDLMFEARCLRRQEKKEFIINGVDRYRILPGKPKIYSSELPSHWKLMGIWNDMQ